MEYISALNISDFTNYEKVRKELKRKRSSRNKASANPISDTFITEGDDALFGFLNRHGLANEPELLVLSSNRHYYYDYEDLRGVKTLINQKKLNHIKELNEFLKNIHNALSPNTNFIGYFSDLTTQKGISLSSRMYKKVINFLDSKIEFEIDKFDMSRRLESHGFKVIEMTEINGLTYFLTQN
jgi:hypothetical protein